MMLTIGILGIILVLFGIIKLFNDEKSYPLLSGAMTVIAWWNICFPFAIILLVILCIFLIAYIISINE